MIDEAQVRDITKKVLDEEHLLNFIKIFEKEHNLFRGSHDKIGLPETLEIHQTIINQIINKTEDGAIKTDMISDGAIVNKHLYDACVDANKIADEAITEAKVLADAITAAKIAVAGLDGETGDVAANHIVADMLQTDCVTSEKILAGAVTASKIDVVGLDGETGRICVVDATDADEIVDGINAHALTLIEPGKVLISGETDLSDWRHGVDATLIDGGKIYAQSITVDQILAGTITADRLDFTPYVIGTNDLDDIAEGTDYGKVLATSLSAGKILLTEAEGDLDDISEGTNYGKVAITDISAGHILLATCDGDLDDIDDGSSYGKVALTSISAGKIIVAGLDSGVTARMFQDGTTKDNIEAWRKAEDVTMIDGGKIYAQSITAAQILAGTITAEKINVSDFINFPSDENLVGYWSLDEGTGTLAVDGSGNGNNGTLTDMAEDDWVAGIAGTGLDFDGNNDHVEVANDASLNFGSSTDFTIAAWIKTDSYSGMPHIVNKGSVGSGGKRYVIAIYHLGGDAGKLYVNVDDNVNNLSLADTINVDDDAWHHVAATFDRDGYMRAYVDGVERGTAVDISGLGDIDDASKKLAIGIQSDDLAGNPFDGLIDEVRIYNTALTASEIKALYLHPEGSRAVRISGGQIEADTITASQIIAGTITADELILGQRQHWYSIASDTVKNSNDTERTTTSATYVKVKEIKLNEDTGKMRIRFGLKRVGGTVTLVAARIYLNGVAIGTARTNNTTDYAYHDEDLQATEGFAKDDLIQIYAHRSTDADTTCYVEDFQLRYTRAVSVAAGHELSTGLPTVDQAVFDVTNQDP